MGNGRPSPAPPSLRVHTEQIGCANVKLVDLASGGRTSRSVGNWLLVNNWVVTVREAQSVMLSRLSSFPTGGGCTCSTVHER